MAYLLVAFKSASGGVTVVSAANPLPVTGGGGGGGGATVTATAAAPTYTEGQTDAALSADLKGNLRTLPGTISGFQRYRATVASTGVSVGDMLAQLIDVDATGTTLRQKWVNIDTGAVVANQSMSNVMPVDEALLLANGFPSDEPWSGVGDGTEISLLKKLSLDEASTLIAVGSETARQMVILNPDGSAVDFNETVDFLPQTEINPDTVTSLPFSVSGADTDAVIAAVVDKRHVIVGGIIEFSGAAAVTFTQKGSTETYNVVAGEKWILDFSPVGHWDTNVNEAFSIGKSAAITVRGKLQYRSLD